MGLRIKNWDKFQHFKDRRPPWVKLYRDILDDIEWHELDPKAAKVLVMLWLIASEDGGNVPDTKQLAFRLRLTPSETVQLLNKLNHWLEQTDISTISSYQQTDSPETETETETDFCAAQAQRDSLMTRFELFYVAYPKKRNRGDAEKAWKALKPDEELTRTIVEAVRVAKQRDDWCKDGGQFIPYPSSWLRAKGWEDGMHAALPLNGQPALPDFMRGAL
jgi:hypothetical protein